MPAPRQSNKAAIKAQSALHQEIRGSTLNVEVWSFSFFYYSGKMQSDGHPRVPCLRWRTRSVVGRCVRFQRRILPNAEGSGSVCRLDARYSYYQGDFQEPQPNSMKPLPLLRRCSPKVMGLPSSEGQLMDDLPHAVKRIPVDFWAAYAAGSRA